MALLIAAPVALAVVTTYLVVHGPRAAFPTAGPRRARSWAASTRRSR
jgi:hypothetical protein